MSHLKSHLFFLKVGLENCQENYYLTNYAVGPVLHHHISLLQVYHVFQQSDGAWGTAHVIRCLLYTHVSYHIATTTPVQHPADGV